MPTSSSETPLPPSMFTYYMENKRTRFELPLETPPETLVDCADEGYFDSLPIERSKTSSDDDGFSNASGTASSLISEELATISASYAIPVHSSNPCAKTHAQFLRSFARPYDKIVMLILGGESEITEEVVKELGPLDMVIQPVAQGKSSYRCFLETAMERNVDVLLCPPQSRSIFGSNDMFHRARDIGLMLVRSPFDAEVRRWLLCVKGSKECQQATELLVRLVGFQDYVCVFSCVTIPTNSPNFTPAVQKAKEEEAIEWTKSAEKMISHRHLEFVTRYIIITTGKPAQAAMAYAEKQSIDIIVCGRSKPTAFEKIGLAESFSDMLVNLNIKQTILIVCRK